MKLTAWKKFFWSNDNAERKILPRNFPDLNDVILGGKGNDPPLPL